ncbi:MAG: hypothetical protein J5J04_13050 [Anaerolineae bacterium]|nr:hypothetical protein [Anaerolineae bacterium]
MSKHTPGPWEVGKISHRKQRVDINSPVPDPRLNYSRWDGLARVYGVNGQPLLGSKIMLANARLIAAAPELLEALTDLLGVTEEVAKKYGLSYSELESYNAAARAAIRKATGEE